MQAVLHAPVDDQVLTWAPDRRPPWAADGLPLPVAGLLLRDQAPEVPGRPGIARRGRLGQQPLRADLPLRDLDLRDQQSPDALVVPAPIDPLGGSVLGLQDPLDGLVGDAAHLGGASVGADLAVGSDDVQLLPRRQQWSPLGGER